MTSQAQDLQAPPAPPLPDDLVSSTAFLLARLGMTVKLAAVEELVRAGFTIPEYAVLAILGEGAQKTQAAIADVLSIDRSQLVGVLDTLEERGLVERRRNPDDRRRHTVSLTGEGKRRLVKLRAVVQKVDDSFLEPLDEKERKQLHELLLRILCARDCRYARRS